jgi:hypothetical protein
MILCDDDKFKIVDLRRIYGKVGTSDLINTGHSLVEAAIGSTELPDKEIKHIHSGIRTYWKKWMSDYRM